MEDISAQVQIVIGRTTVESAGVALRAAGMYGSQVILPDPALLNFVDGVRGRFDRASTVVKDAGWILAGNLRHLLWGICADD